MNLSVDKYLPPDEWMLRFSWGASGYHQQRVKAATKDEAEKLAKQMQEILEVAVNQCRSIADKTLSRGVMFDD